MMSDPVADLLTRIRNALGRKHPQTEIPHSIFKEGVVKVLKEEGYIEGYKVSTDETKPERKLLHVFLKYDGDRRPVIKGIRRISKPGCRVFRQREKLKKVLDGLGISILSTSRGIVSNKAAEKLNVGGELICTVW